MNLKQIAIEFPWSTVFKSMCFIFLVGIIVNVFITRLYNQTRTPADSRFIVQSISYNLNLIIDKETGNEYLESSRGFTLIRSKNSEK